MKRCALCGGDITDKKQRVMVCSGRWFRRRRKFFHLDCFTADKRKSYGVIRDMIKS